jgi:argininosuccinate synthase
LNRVVVACFGDAPSIALISRLALTAEVIAVAFDFGGAVPLGDLRECALSAGAVRCHAMDVRDEFARDSLLPAVRARGFADPSDAFAVLAPQFAARKLADVAAIERATWMMPDDVRVSPRVPAAVATGPTRLDIGFDNGLPTSVNGVEMSLSELMESIETITGESALRVLARELPAGSPDPLPA